MSDGLLDALTASQQLVTAMIRIAGSIGSFTGWPLMMMVPPDVRSLRLAGLKIRNAP